ncbi:NAD-dependent epimerase/dehydratase family protein [Bacteroidota bacterium]
MKISITGASGHIGTNLCRELLKQGHQLKVLINQYTDSLQELDLERIQGNLRDPESLNTLATGSDIFIHLAASISINGNQSIMDTNFEGTQNVIHAVRKSGIKRLVHFSSIHAISHDPLNQTLDETRSLAVDDHIIYNRSKALAEQAVLEAVRDGLDAVIINPTSVMGPNDFKPSLIGQAIIQLYLGKIPALIPGGYDWVDVRDVVSGTITAIEKGRKGESYLLSGQYVSLADLYDMLRRLKGNGKSMPVIPFWLAEFGVPFLKIWAKLTKSQPLYTRESVEILKTAHQGISSAKAAKELGYQSRPFKETLKDTVTWFRENHYL